MRAHVLDAGALGLYMTVPGDSDVSWWRHATNAPDPRLWDVTVVLSRIAGQVLGRYVFQRPAVVDDFGSLVCVGEPQ